MEIGIELHERSHERTNRPVYDTNSKGDVLAERFSQFPESSAEHSSRKRTVTTFSKLNLCTIYMSTMLYAAILVVESLFQFRLFQRSHSFISFYWLESCVIVFIFKSWGRKRIKRLVDLITFSQVQWGPCGQILFFKKRTRLQLKECIIC